MQQPSYLVDIQEGFILLTPVTDEGSKQKVQRLSIETAERLIEALTHAVMAAKVKYYT